MQLPSNWREHFFEVYERARLREMARLDAAAGRVDPLVGDPFHLDVLLAMVRKITADSHGLTSAQRLALSNELLSASDEIVHRTD